MSTQDSDEEIEREAEACIARIESNFELQRRDGRIPISEETFMLEMLDAGLVGMDGFKYCWPEEAEDSRRRTLAALPEWLRDRRGVA